MTGSAEVLPHAEGTLGRIHMTKNRRALAGLAAAAGIAAAVTLAPGASAARSAELDLVTVTNENGVVRIGTGVPGQPLLGASVNTNTGEVCVGFSYQIPFCASSGIGTVSAAAIPSPVWVDADASDGRIGAGVRIGTGSIVGVSYSTSSGQACVGVGMQRPFCAQLT
jgi:hypothetical protein